jgi:hypothetical protein
MPTGLKAIVYPKLSHVGIVVSNMDEADGDNNSRFGLPRVVRRETLHFADAVYRGTRISFAADFGYVEMGNTSLELIQPIGDDPSPYRDVLDDRGDSVHHLAYVVPSIEQHLLAGRQADAPVSIVLDGMIPGGQGRFVYVEGLVHGALVELLELS